MAPFAAAAPYIVGTTAVLGIQQADRIGKFNEDVQNRNAIIKENEAKILDDKLALDLSRFYKAFEKLEGSTQVALVKSGVETDSGTAANIKLSNLYEKELEVQMMKYNSEIAQSQKLEEANFARIQGTLARASGRQQAIGYLAGAGSSLLTMKQMGMFS